MKNNLDKITKNGRALFLAYDHGLEHGPTDFDDQSIDPGEIIKIADSGFFTGFICQKGIAEKYYDKNKHKVPLIIKLNGKTNLHPDEEPYSPQICSIEEALDLGAVAVGYTLYVGSEHEAKMMKELAEIEEAAEEEGIPVIGWMYPRGKAVAGREKTKEILSYSARLGLELGLEMIKIPYTTNQKTLAWVAKAAGKVKVVLAGGSKIKEKEFLETTRGALEVGVSGLAVGRNVWRAKEPLKIAEKINKIVFN
ncbi:MAG TPA: fructose-bisphosphate aldolase [Patescibacteria group bacterium]|nr:fructose-bisphosphate aldolase [Patescibacteria group bacterium]